VTKFAFVSAERGNHAVATLCRVVGASVSGFYAWRRAIPAVQNRAKAKAELRDHIGRIFASRRHVYGSPRIHAELRREGRRHSRRRMSRSMRELGLSARQGRRRTPRTTDSRHDLRVAPNLLDRNFAAERPDTVWLADISYIATGEGWLYLAAIKDMATREIVGWSMADHLKAGLCLDALVMALHRCQPPRGLIHHSDRGVQYASGPYCQVLERHGIKPSMSRRGNCLDNAPMESFFASLKKEHVYHVRFRTREEAKAAVFDYIEIFYNRSSQRTSRYVVAEKRFCCLGLDAARCLELLRARRAMFRAAGTSSSARLKSQGPSPRGCSASISPRSAAILSVRGATPTSAAA